MEVEDTMSTITLELPDHLTAELAASKIPVERLQAFLVSAVEGLLRRHQATVRDPGATPWTGAFEDRSMPFVRQLIEDNQELFEELARS